MEKTKLGISVPMLGMIACLATLFGGYTVTVLVVGYCLLIETDSWLRRTAVKALAVSLLAGLLCSVLDLVPSLLSWISEFLRLFGGHFDYGFASNLFNILTGAIMIAKSVILLAMGFLALSKNSFKIPVIDGIINKAFEE